MIAVTVRGESTVETKTRLATRDQIEQAGAGNSAEHLSDDVRKQIGSRKSFPRPQSHRHRRIQMTSRDVADRIGHRQHGQAKSERHTEQTNAYAGERGGNYGAATASENQPERTEEFSRASFSQGHERLLSVKWLAQLARNGHR